MGFSIKHAAIITCDGGHVIPDGFVRIDGDKIIEIGPMSQFNGSAAINARGKILMPGFVNAHAHIYSQFARGISAAKASGFTEILKNLWWPLDEALCLDDVYYSGLTALIEAVKSGVTSVVDHHASYGCTTGSLGMLAKAFEKIGVRGALCYEVSDRHGEQERDRAIEENFSLSFGKEGLLRQMFGLHAAFTLSPQTLAKVAKANEKRKLPYHIHVAEAADDKDAVKKLFDAGILREGSIAAHCVHIGGEDFSLLKKSGVFVVHNPVSNMNNAVGIAPYLKLCAAGVPVGIGTDGMSMSVFPDVKTASVVHKSGARDPQAGWNEVRKSTLETNPIIVSQLFGKEIGVLKKGAAADLIIVDSLPFTELNRDNYWGHVLFGVLNSRVHTTVVNGRVLMENFQLVGIDEEAISKEAKKLSAAMWKRKK